VTTVAATCNDKIVSLHALPCILVSIDLSSVMLSAMTFSECKMPSTSAESTHCLALNIACIRTTVWVSEISFNFTQSRPKLHQVTREMLVAQPKSQSQHHRLSSPVGLVGLFVSTTSLLIQIVGLYKF